ncbi:protein of unknown function [Tenacibaculum sp. 190130A14a]|uniref:Plasmodium RESA N-terminal domain-containing protein n=1 Tax=Tenacibaculum polynesiense TaxID=3137857 RepID=A0ABP1EZI4_9FLAO
MEQREQQEVWEDIKNIWNTSADSKEINILMSELVIELKSKTSEFERNSIKKDVTFMKGAVSDFEKKSIQRDLAILKKGMAEFEKNIVQRGVYLFKNLVKVFLKRFKGTNKDNKN